MTALELYWQTLIRGQRGWWNAPLLAVLWLISKAYQCISFWRHLAYDRAWLRRRHVPGPVIVSIGNIVVGGTGKTPVLLKLGQELCRNGVERLTILSRGYRSTAETAPTPYVIAPNQTPNAEMCGDEPCLLAQRLPQAYVHVSRDRYASAKMAVAAGAQVLLLDDGLQHRQLVRDFDIAVVDADFPLGGGHLFPRGGLREHPRGLARAQGVVLNHVRSLEHFHHVRKELYAYTSAPAIGMQPVVSEIVSLDARKRVLPSLAGVRVGVFCGIAQPRRFVEEVTALGATVVESLFSADHRLPALERLEAFAKQAQKKGAEWLLCTEKDAVKLPTVPELSLPIAFVRLQLAIIAGQEHWSSLVSQITNLVYRRTDTDFPSG